MTTISIDELEELCIKALIKGGVRKSDAKIAVDHYLENELSGKSSHGIVRVVEAAKAFKRFDGGQENPEIEKDTGSMVVLDGKRQIGVVAGKAALDIAIERAPEHGIALVGVHNHIGNSGSMAYYLRRLAKAGLIAIMGTNSVAMVAPPGGKKRRLGTNPVGIAIPDKDGEGVIADFGTSAMVYGKMLVKKERGEAIPEGTLIDKDGTPSTNIEDAYDGAMLPLAGYKGFALGLMVELLAGPLIGGKAVKQNLYDNDGLFIIAIDPSKMGHENYIEAVTAALQEVKDTPTRDGFEVISLPGERSNAILEKSRKCGEVDVTDKTLNDLRKLAPKD